MKELRIKLNLELSILPLLANPGGVDKVLAAFGQDG